MPKIGVFAGIGARHRRATAAALVIEWISGGVLTRAGSTVTWEPWTYSVSGLDTNTVTFVLDGVDQAPGAITFPYTLASGHTLAARGSATKAGYAAASPNSNLVLNPAAIDIPTAEWNATEAALDADTRKTLVTVARDNRAGFKIHVLRGEGSGGLAYLSTENPDQTYLGAGSEMTSAGAGLLTWQSSGQATRGGTGRARLVEVETAVGNTSARWCSEIDSFPVSNVPNVPTGVVISTGAGAGLIYVDVANAGTVPASDVARPIIGMYATIDGGAPFALTPSGGLAGRRTITALGTVPVSVQLYWQNANGAGAATAAVSVTPGVATLDIPTTLRPDVTYDGETFTFAAAAPVGFYEDGSPFVLSDAGVTVTAMGTPSTVIDGHIAHGAMSSKPYMPTTGLQGFDGKIAATVPASCRVTYGNNIDPTAAGAAYIIAANDEDGIIKSKRRSGVVAVGAHWVVEKYLPVTFLPASKRPKAGDFRPGLCSLDKTSYLNINDIDLGCCRSLDLSGMGYPTVAVALARWVKAMPFFGLDGEQLRALQVTGNLSATNYIADYAPPLIGDLAALLNSNCSDAEKIQMGAAIAPVANDIAVQWYRGYLGRAGAGQHEFYGPVLAVAAALFNSAYLRTAFDGLISNLDQVFWATADNIGDNTDWPAKNESGQFEYVAPRASDDIGKAVWGVDGYYNIKMTQDGSQMNRTYGDSGGSGRARADTWAPLMLFTANRAMPNGYDIVSGGPGTPLNNTASRNSHRSAMLHRVDRDERVYPLNDIGMSTRVRALINGTRGLWPQAKLLRVPDPIYFSNFVAGANLVTWNYDALIAGDYFSSSPITDQHLYISQDNVQFLKIPSVAAIGSRALPGGIPHWCALSLENAQGEGRRSYTFKHRVSSPADRGYIVPTGTPTGAVTCIDLPKLMKREIPDHDNVPWYVPIEGILPAGTPIFVGSGIWDGALSGPVTTQVQIENVLNSNVWVNFGAADVARIDPGISEGNKGFRVAATRNGVTAYSARVITAAIPSIPAGTIVDTQFGPEFPLVYPALWASMLANSVAGTLIHRPYEPWRGANAAAPGGLVLLKTAGTPRIVGEVPGLTIGQQYRFQAEVVVEGYFKLAGDAQWTANGLFKLGSAINGAQYYTGPINRDTTSGPPPMGAVKPLTINIDVTFTATATSAWLYSNIATSTGGSAGGYPALSSLRLAPAA